MAYFILFNSFYIVQTVVARQDGQPTFRRAIKSYMSGYKMNYISVNSLKYDKTL